MIDLVKQGYRDIEIAEKLGLDRTYVAYRVEYFRKTFKVFNEKWEETVVPLRKALIEKEKNHPHL